MSTLKITKIPTNSKTKNVAQKTMDPYLKIYKIPITSNKGGWKGHSPSRHSPSISPSKKENKAGGGVTLDTNPEELCPDINGFNDLAIDEITGVDIPPDNLIRLRADGHLHCYDAVTLKRTVGQNDLKEPMTRIPLPESIIEMIQNHPAQISSEIKESIELGRQQRIAADRAEGERNFRDLQLRVAAESRQQQQQPPRPFGQYVQPQSEQKLTEQQLNQQFHQRHQQFAELLQRERLAQSAYDLGVEAGREPAYSTIRAWQPQQQIARNNLNPQQQSAYDLGVEAGRQDRRTRERQQEQEEQQQQRAEEQAVAHQEQLIQNELLAHPNPQLRTRSQYLEEPLRVVQQQRLAQLTQKQQQVRSHLRRMAQVLQVSETAPIPELEQLRQQLRQIQLQYQQASANPQ